MYAPVHASLKKQIAAMAHARVLHCAQVSQESTLHNLQLMCDSAAPRPGDSRGPARVPVTDPQEAEAVCSSQKLGVRAGGEAVSSGERASTREAHMGGSHRPHTPKPWVSPVAHQSLKNRDLLLMFP